MLHDFAITENYIIIPDMPMEVNPQKVATERAFMAGYNPKGACRYGFMKKYSQHNDQVQWFDLPAHYAFHFGNAWEEKNDQGEDIIKLYSSQTAQVDAEFKSEHPFFNHDQ